jgi:DNA-binding MarR family transcriptional regulator
MTTIPAAAEFGYTLAMANDAATAVVRQQLAERGVKPERWGALQLIAKRGPALSRTALSDQLARSRALSADSARELLAEIETNGLIRGDKEIELTPEGQALYRSLNEHHRGKGSAPQPPRPQRHRNNSPHATSDHRTGRERGGHQLSRRAPIRR